MSNVEEGKYVLAWLISQILYIVVTQPYFKLIHVLGIHTRLSRCRHLGYWHASQQSHINSTQTPSTTTQGVFPQNNINQNTRYLFRLGRRPVPIKFILPECVSYLGERGVLCVGGVSSLFPTGLYSDKSIFWQVDIPTGRYSDRSFFRQVVIPTGRYSDRSLFRQIVIPTGRYSDRSLFRQVVERMRITLFIL